MNVFVLSTGRCGSTTFIEACKHIQNFTAAHESRHGLLGDDHFSYPQNHIEADNRLSWFSGRLDRAYGNDAFYVHLTRERLEVAKSYLKRYSSGLIKMHDYSIINAYSQNILGYRETNAPIDICLDYCDTIDANIEYFLQNKSNKMVFKLEDAKEHFQEFWTRIGAEGSISDALAEWDIPHNQSFQFDRMAVLKKRLKYLIAAIYR